MQVENTFCPNFMSRLSKEVLRNTFRKIMPFFHWFQKMSQIFWPLCRTIGPSFAASLEPKAHCQDIASLSLSIGITLVVDHLNWLNWFHLLILMAKLSAILIGCKVYLSPFLDVCNDVYVKNLFSCITGLWNFACRMLSFDLWSKWI